MDKHEEGVEERLSEHTRDLAELFRLNFDAIIKDNSITSYVEKLFMADWLFMNFMEWRIVRIVPQHKILNYRVDFYIQDMNAVIEIDSFAFHERDPKQLEYERVREREIESEGYRVIRYAASEILKNSFNLIVDLRREAVKRRGGK